MEKIISFVVFAEVGKYKKMYEFEELNEMFKEGYTVKFTHQTASDKHGHCLTVVLEKKNFK